ncbi:hypothetical protein ACTS93_15275 [Empedobacter falsenii]
MNYLDDIKKLIFDHYHPGEPEVSKMKFTLAEIKIQLNSIFPANSFDTFDLKNILDELGIEPKYEQKKEIVYREIEGQTDADGNPLREKDVITYDDFVFYYYFEKIN